MPLPISSFADDATALVVVVAVRRRRRVVALLVAAAASGEGVLLERWVPLRRSFLTVMDKEEGATVVNIISSQRMFVLCARTSAVLDVRPSVLVLLPARKNDDVRACEGED